MKIMKTSRLIFFGLVLAGLVLIWVLPNAAQESNTRTPEQKDSLQAWVDRRWKRYIQRHQLSNPE